MTMGWGGDGFYLPRTHTLPLPRGDEKLNYITVPDRFRYSRPIPAMDFFLKTFIEM